MTERPPMDQTLMYIANLMAERSTCQRAHVGAVIALEGRIITTGFNGAPAGLPHCDHDDSFVPPCVNAVHAETNAIAFAAKHGLTTNGATIFTTHSPCIPCAQLIINAGIIRVVAGQLYRVPAGWTLLQQANITTDRWDA